MTRAHVRLVGLGMAAASALGAPGCGDDARACGEGTVARDGVCVAETMVTCGPGTVLDHDQCMVDPSVCPAGTMLVGGRCVEPASQLTVDLEESPEPNGLGIAAGVEASAAPAGIVALAPAGQPLVLHGHLAPFRDADGDGQLDPDVDTYVLPVAGPTVLDVAVTGLGGAVGAFYLAGDPAVDPSYARYGAAVAGTAVQRRLLLPVAGRYAIAIADARAIAFGPNPPPTAGARAPGGPGAEYYVALTVQPMPVPAPIALTAGTGRQTGALAPGDVQLFTASLGGGSFDVELAMPGPAAASLAVIDGGALAGYADENPGATGRPPTASRLTVSGLAPGAAPVIAVDAVYTAGPAPEPFTLTIALQ
ncbi:MAG TPA: EB domain-containing protein [Kofleriaceae bacterium]|jgi:hypothetical protein|nr:EB domain-containing protein [Kofleriaceae bacterium]